MKFVDNDFNMFNFRSDTSIALAVALTCALLCFFLILLGRYILKPRCQDNSNCRRKYSNNSHVNKETRAEMNEDEELPGPKDTKRIHIKFTYS